MLLSLTYNSIKKDYVICERGKRRSAFAPIKRNLLSIPGMVGALLESTDTEVRIIQQPIYIRGKDRFEVRKLEEDLAAWLITDKPVPLIFDDEPDRTYYALVDGSLDIEDIVKFGHGTVTFVCLDSYKYGAEKPINIVNGLATIQNNGTAETKPVFTLNVLAPTTFIDIVTDGAYMRLGQPIEVESIPFEPETVILEDVMSSLTGWAVGSFEIESGQINGTMAAGTGAIYASNYGSGSGWHGPAIAKSLSEQLDDFILEATVKFETTMVSQIGKIEVYALDVNNKSVAKLAMRDNHAGMDLTQPEIYANTDTFVRKNIIVRNQDERWEDFYGLLRIVRKAGKITGYVARVSSTGKHSNIKTFSINGGDITRKIASVGVQIAGFGAYATPATVQIHHLSVRKLNEQEGIPYIAKAGDTVEIDHKTNDIRINGETKLKKSFGSSFFSLKPGENIITFEPADKLSGEGIYREAFK